MAVTETLLPPICEAMLPQKFSAATTWIFADDTFELAAELGVVAPLESSPLHAPRSSTPKPVTVSATILSIIVRHRIIALVLLLFGLLA